MTVFLKAKSGASIRDVAVIPPNRPLTIGRTEQNDVAFPEDSLMSSRHLTIQLEPEGCLIQDLGSTNGTLVNGVAVRTASIGPGDVFQCGATEFLVDWSDTVREIPVRDPATRANTAGNPPGAILSTQVRRPVPASGNPSESQPPELSATQGYVAATAEDIVRRFKLRQRIPLTPEAEETPGAFLQRLASRAAGKGMLEFLSFALPKRCAVWWLINCVRETQQPDEHETLVLKATEEWVRRPTDQNRRAAMKLIEDADLSRAANWTAMAAFQSAGSTAPENSPFVGAREDVSGKSILAGVSLAAVTESPSAAVARRELLVELGKKIAAGELPFSSDE